MVAFKSAGFFSREPEPDPAFHILCMFSCPCPPLIIAPGGKQALELTTLLSKIL